MKLNIKKLKKKLEKIDSDVYVEIQKEFNIVMEHHFNIIQFNNLISIIVEDTDNLKDDIERLYCYGKAFFCISDFNNMRVILDFIENNERAIKTAMLESIEE